ncbi:hypothetical protein PF005_g5874 [Phytophthora fragariae]|uniref:Reverse transcriptase/retrotransposon-derived protein RNase H-like domain-containing protein n=1 Tax=Phytophthora fragariae TaxID=53985 RepID=A0A6A3YW11_9STRA|nr:hypothetical protein PF005_g5874 [Phytophthora fragariae]
MLGLVFDTSASTVAMPAPKIAKVQGLVAHTFHAAWISRGQLRSLLGSPRHVATCGRLAQAFLQCLRAGENALHRLARVTIMAPMWDDLVWWWHILSNPSLNGVPLEYFAAFSEPDLTVTTDASDEGLCAIVPFEWFTLNGSDVAVADANGKTTTDPGTVTAF